MRLRPGFYRELEKCLHSERGLCGLSISQSSHSIWTHSSTPVCTCHSPARLCFSYTCSCGSRSWQLPAIGKCKNICPVVFTSRKQQSSSHPTVKNRSLDSPVLCCRGCWVTASLLEPCPIIQLLLPPGSAGSCLSWGPRQERKTWSHLDPLYAGEATTDRQKCSFKCSFPPFSQSFGLFRPSPLPPLALKHNTPCCRAHVPPLKKTDLIKKE